MSDISFLSILLMVLAVPVAIVAIAHVILNKRDVRAALGWTGLILLNPLLGAIAYNLFGINRIRRRAVQLISDAPQSTSSGDGSGEPVNIALGDRLGKRFARLARTVHRATGHGVLADNFVAPLLNGDQAYPEMLRAIDRAERSVILTTYIFDNDSLGHRFVDALAAAVARGVAVRVLIDGVGARYSRPPIRRALRRRGVPTQLFLPTRWPALLNPYLNLRNHRKLLLVDGRSAFVGGLNIRHGCLLAEHPDEPVQDLHFAVRGPVVERLFEIVAQDWRFASGEVLEGAAWASDPRPAGDVGLQAFGDGPDEDFETLRWTLLAALGTARSSVRISTPYFLPDTSLLAGLRLAALRGVEVSILLPEVNNLRFVQWAMTAQLWQVLEPGCRVWLVPPPFDHSKLLVIDDTASWIGSANWDMRSLRLNFELAIACYDRSLARNLLRLSDEKIARSRELTLEEVDARPLPIRLRDGAARLLAPYL